MSYPVRAEVFAPAKVNLTLHVVGQRHDGYHLLDSLVVFADVGDHLDLHSGWSEPLRIVGPEAGSLPTGDSNLILRAAESLPSPADVGFALTKNLPVSSGIGGGSADAAAAVRGLLALRGEEASAALMGRLLSLGADIPMCMASVAARVSGIGEILVPVPNLPVLEAVLVNPRIGLSTPSVFKAMHRRDNAPMPPVLPQFSDSNDLTDWLCTQRNDLEPAALGLEPAVAAVKSALEAEPQCVLARMSGSGATCFGIFPTTDAAQTAAIHLHRAHPDWWVTPTRLGSQAAAVEPRLS